MSFEYCCCEKEWQERLPPLMLSLMLSLMLLLLTPSPAPQRRGVAPRLCQQARP